MAIDLVNVAIDKSSTNQMILKILNEQGYSWS